MSARPIAWTIAGSDSGGGAGLQADLKAFEALDAHGCSAVAAVTAQNSVAVSHAQAVDTGLLDAQLQALADDLPPQAIKTGMLGSADNVRCVARWVDKLRGRRPVALVVDPVWRASTGAGLSGEMLRQALLEELLPRATVVTPNRAEAAWLLGAAHEIGRDDAGQVVLAAARLRALGPQAVVVTGGDAGGASSLDWIDTPQDRGWLGLPRVDTPHHHGSGCAHAASLAAALAHGFCHADAAVWAKMATTHALRRALPAGHGAGPVRPAAGFALRGELLPWLHDGAEPPPSPFPALQAPAMGLYAIVNSADWIERLLAAGVRTLQLRVKQDGPGALPPRRLSAEVQRSVQAARALGAQLFVNDHWQLAIEHGAYGVHLGQEDLRTADLDALQAAGLRLGLSSHSPWEVCRALAWRPSYIACGPVHATATKAMPWRPQGEGNLAYWCRVLPGPVVAIAGMDGPRARRAVRCGAAGVAVLRGVTQAADPTAAVAALQAAMAEAALLDEPQAVPGMPRPTLPGPVPWDGAVE